MVCSRLLLIAACLAVVSARPMGSAGEAGPSPSKALLPLVPLADTRQPSRHRQLQTIVFSYDSAGLPASHGRFLEFTPGMGLLLLSPSLFSTERIVGSASSSFAQLGIMLGPVLEVSHRVL